MKIHPLRHEQLFAVVKGIKVSIFVEMRVLWFLLPVLFVLYGFVFRNLDHGRIIYAAG